ncbi:MAG: hypothetical protein FGM15_09585 [Chthoniobacterales bacterium]|nr:hypothetical protein [Chthoniobacterales bacterium]
MNIRQQTDESVEGRGSWPAMLDFYRSGIDVSLIEENLKLAVPERMEKFASFMRLVEALRSSQPPVPAAE